MRAIAAVLVTAGVALAAPSMAAAKTIRLFSKEVASHIYDTNGNPVQGAPQAGDTFTNTGKDYKGTLKHHGKRVVAWDHLSCLLLDPTTFLARCDGVLSFPNGMLAADQQVVTLSQPRSVFKITDAFGAYRRAKGGTVTSISGPQNSNTTELVIRY